MRAIVIREFGGRDRLELADIPRPKLLPDGVRIRILAAGVNPVDWKTREGRQDPRFPHVFPVVLGWDAAGVVEEVGPAAVGFAPGDEVFAYCRKHFIGEGTYAEEIVLPADFVAAKPTALSFADAAAVPLAAQTAYQVLVERLQIQTGETVLVHAAAGGVGHFAVQIAAALGAKPIGTASEANHEFLRELGAVECIDYRSGDLPEHVDCALDTIGGETLERTLRIAGRTCSIVQPMAGEGRSYHYVRPDGRQLATLAELVDEGKLRPHVQEAFPLEQTARAHELLEEGHVRGKLVLTLD
ncbi:MAG TPA: NADP-dependent oxidoreductase [Gaiellaceae bacterium]|jgi:NADPH:quinone reductase-like Zn-dependent oxidoreductase